MRRWAGSQLTAASPHFWGGMGVSRIQQHRPAAPAPLVPPAAPAGISPLCEAENPEDRNYGSISQRANASPDPKGFAMRSLMLLPSAACLHLAMIVSTSH